MRTKVNLTIDEDLTEQARALGINMSRVADEAIGKAIKIERNRLWNVENQSAIDAYNEEIREHGLPLEKYRLF